MSSVLKIVSTALTLVLVLSCESPLGVSDGGDPGQTTDTTAPSEVSNLAAAGGDGQVTLNWTNPTDSDFDHARVYYGESPQNLAQFDGTVDDAGTIVGELTNFTFYTFRVVAVDTSGNASAGATIQAFPTDGTAGAIVYVSATAGDDLNPGTAANPMATIRAALDIATQAVHVAAGEYVVDHNSYVDLRPGIAIRGGFSATDWSDRRYVTPRDRANPTYQTEIRYASAFSGTAADPPSAVKASGSDISQTSVLEGFVIDSTNSPLLSVGVALSEQASPTIRNNSIYSARTGVRGLYLSKPLIQDNLIEVNATEFDAKGVELEDGSAADVIGNSITVNAPDTMFGLHLYNDSGGVIRNNVVHLNRTSSYLGHVDLMIGAYMWVDNAPIIQNNTFTFTADYGHTMTEPATGGVLGIVAFATDYPDTPRVENNIFSLDFDLESGTIVGSSATAIQLNSTPVPSVRNNVFHGFDYPLYDGGGLGFYPSVDDANQLSYWDSNQSVPLDTRFLVDPLASDVRFAPGISTAITEGGLDLSADFTGDLFGNTRTVPWSVGAIESDYQEPLVGDAVYLHPDGTDGYIGSADYPKASLRAALSAAEAWGKSEVRIAAGTYPIVNNYGIDVPAGISIRGGYSSSDWSDRSWETPADRASAEHKTTIRYAVDPSEISTLSGSFNWLLRYVDSSTDGTTVLEGVVLEVQATPTTYPNGFTPWMAAISLRNGASPTIQCSTIDVLEEQEQTGGSAYLVGIEGASSATVVRSEIFVRGRFEHEASGFVEGIRLNSGYFANNLIISEFDSATVLAQDRSVVGITAGSITAVNNTIYLDNVNRSLSVTKGIFGNSIEAYNNVLYSANGYDDEYAFYVYTGNDLTLVNNHVQGFDFAARAGGDVPSFAGIASTGEISGNVFAAETDPLFVDVSIDDYRLSADAPESAKSGAETTAHNLSVDLVGALRGAGYSKGAIEY